MKDRIPANPGRVLITPENGGAPYYATVTRADNPTQPGDPLNKNTLLKDATAALLGLSKDSVPDDGFQVLAGLLGLRRLDKNLANEYLFALGTGSISTGAQEVKNIGIDMAVYAYGDSVSLVDGKVVIDNEIELQAWEYGGSSELNQTLFNLLEGKYFRVSNDGNTADTVYKFYSAVSAEYTYSMDATVSVLSVTTGYTYYNSPDPNDYPASEGYLNLGRVGEGARIVTGSYTGTVKVGSSNPNRLTFSSLPKLIVISNGSNNGIILPSGTPKGGIFGQINNSSVVQPLTVSVSGTQVSWYSNYSSSSTAVNSQYQLNGSGTYEYVAVL